MHYGIHLPHAGERASPILIRRFAVQAEALGIADVWVSEHIILPRTQFLRPLPFYEPVLTLTWVAAVTERVNLGTSVLVLPMRHPIPLAKELATLQNLSNGRLILGAGVGWLEPEFAALGAPFHDRGRRTLPQSDERHIFQWCRLASASARTISTAHSPSSPKRPRSRERSRSNFP